MRFCTTHRACAIGNLTCEVVAAVWPYFQDLESCTLVDALIVTKEDGKWPEWVYVLGAKTGDILDALERAEP